MQRRRKSTRHKKVSLPLVLIVPFVLQIMVAVGLVGYLSFRNGQHAVEDLANQLMNEVSKRVEQKLTDYLATPYLVNQLNANAVSRGELKLAFGQRNQQAEHYIWQQLRLFPSLKWILFGVEQDGTHLGAWRTDNNQELQLAIANPANQSLLTYYAVDAQGNRTAPVKVEHPQYDPRKRPWYRAAVSAHKPTWTQIYPGFTPGTVFIAASQPIYAPSGKLMGVSAVDMSLLDIQKFLAQVQVSSNGQVFIVERSGLLVASSSQESPFRRIANQPPQRLGVRESQTPLIQATAQSLEQKLHKARPFEQIYQKLQLQFELNQNPHFAQVLPFSDQKGLDWLIVVVVPESDFQAQIHAGTQTTILLCFAALVIAIALGALTSRWVVNPILELSAASQKIAQGKFSQQVNEAGTHELSILANSFNQMSQEIQQSRHQLEEYSRSLEQKVTERTRSLQQEVQNRTAAELALQAANQELQRIAYLDGLTQIANRRRFDERLAQEWRRMKRDQLPLALVLCDVDYFKQYNDHYGHQMGDECLRKVAQVIESAAKRPADLAARYGGEEFTVILPNTPLAGVIQVAEEIQHQMKLLQLPHQVSSVSPYVTLSFGIASIVPMDTISLEELIAKVDRALYRAKIAGRDRIEISENYRIAPVQEAGAS
jgi:diguanylate cyclase (GGDEF)-like protein